LPARKKDACAGQARARHGASRPLRRSGAPRRPERRNARSRCAAHQRMSAALWFCHRIARPRSGTRAALAR
jgi:hypothetical protein